MTKLTLRDRLTEYSNAAYQIANTDQNLGVEELNLILTTGEGMTPQLHAQYDAILREIGMQSLMRASAGACTTHIKANNCLPPFVMPPAYKSTLEPEIEYTYTPVQGKTRRGSKGQKMVNLMVARLHYETYWVTGVNGRIKLKDATADDLLHEMAVSKALGDGQYKRYDFVKSMHGLVSNPGDVGSTRLLDRASEEELDVLWIAVYPTAAEAEAAV